MAGKAEILRSITARVRELFGQRFWVERDETTGVWEVRCVSSYVPGTVATCAQWVDPAGKPLPLSWGFVTQLMAGDIRNAPGQSKAEVVRNCFREMHDQILADRQKNTRSAPDRVDKGFIRHHIRTRVKDADRNPDGSLTLYVPARRDVVSGA